MWKLTAQSLLKQNILSMMCMGFANAKEGEHKVITSKK